MQTASSHLCCWITGKTGYPWLPFQPHVLMGSHEHMNTHIHTVETVSADTPGSTQGGQDGVEVERLCDTSNRLLWKHYL